MKRIPHSLDPALGLRTGGKEHPAAQLLHRSLDLGQMLLPVEMDHTIKTFSKVSCLIDIEHLRHTHLLDDRLED